jgi:hypothetical protein
LLNFIGFAGIKDDNSFIERIHPVSLCVIIYFVFSTLFKWSQYFKKSNFIYHINIFVGMWWMFYSYLINGHPASVPIVSYIVPFIFLILIVNTNQEERRYLFNFVHFFMILNSIVGLCEFSLQIRLFSDMSAYAGSEVRRANALLGHPLTNATITGVYILAIVFNIKSYARILFPAFAIIISLFSLAAYSGRAAGVVLLLIMAIEISKGEWLKNKEGKIQYNLFAVAFIALIVLMVVAATAYHAGFFDQFISRFVNDYGSGQTRWLAWDKIRASTLEQILFGREEKYINFIDYFGNRVAVSIESFWLNLLFYNGLIVSMPVSIIFLLGLNQLRKEVSGRVTPIILYFLICISSSVGLGGKTQLLSIFFTIIITLCSISKQESISISI